MAHAGAVRGVRRGCAWRAQGLCMACAGAVHGACKGCVWKLQGLLLIPQDMHSGMSHFGVRTRPSCACRGLAQHRVKAPRLPPACAGASPCTTPAAARRCGGAAAAAAAAAAAEAAATAAAGFLCRAGRAWAGGARGPARCDQHLARWGRRVRVQRGMRRPRRRGRCSQGRPQQSHWGHGHPCCGEGNEPPQQSQHRQGAGAHACGTALCCSTRSHPRRARARALLTPHHTRQRVRGAAASQRRRAHQARRA